MAKILVIGGRGYYGARVVAAVKALDGRLKVPVEVSVAGRSGPVELDLSRPETFGAMQGFDLVVNASDTVGAPPDEALKWCLARQIPWMDMGADAPTAERLLATPPGEGVAVVGVGVFPGLSTALASAVAGPQARKVELGVRLSPLSGAGPGNCALMVQTLNVPGYRYEGGRKIEGPPVGSTQVLPYAETGAAASIQVGLPDTALIRHSTSAPEVASYMALNPGFMRFNFQFLSWVIALSGPLKPLLLKLTEWQLLLLRGVLLRGVSSRVQLTAVADRGTPGERSRTLDFADGQQATAAGVAAAVACFLQGPPLKPGIYTTATLSSCDELLKWVS